MAGADLPHGFDVFEDPETLRSLAHPTRRSIFIAAVHEPVSAKELAERFEQPLARISYHVRTLADAGLLRVVRRTRRRGAVETHYRAVATLDFDDETLRRLPEEIRRPLYQMPVRDIAEDVLRALETGAIDEPDVFIARGHFLATASGRQRLQDEVRSIYEHLAALQKELAAEVEASGEPAYPLNLVLFEYLGERRADRNSPFIVNWDPPGMPPLEPIPEE